MWAMHGPRWHPTVLHGPRMVLWLHSLMASVGTIGGHQGLLVAIGAMYGPHYFSVSRIVCNNKNKILNHSSKVSVVSGLLQCLCQQYYKHTQSYVARDSKIR